MFVEKDSCLSQLYCEVSDIVSDACGQSFVESRVAIKIMTITITVALNFSLTLKFTVASFLYFLLGRGAAPSSESSRSAEGIKGFFMWQGRNVYFSAPTGFGKSLVFQALPLMYNKMKDNLAGSSFVHVLSSLTALIEEQVEYINKNTRLIAVFLHDRLDQAAIDPFLRSGVSVVSGHGV